MSNTDATVEIFEREKQDPYIVVRVGQQNSSSQKGKRNMYYFCGNVCPQSEARLVSATTKSCIRKRRFISICINLQHATLVGTNLEGNDV